MSFRFISTLMLLGSAFSCSDLPPPPIGNLRLGLASGFGEEQYRLAHASFAIEGAVQVALDSDDEPTKTFLERALPEGDYSVQLLDGWQLERTGVSGSQLVAAELSSDNPLSFSILSGELTTVTFQFRTLGAGAPRSGSGGDGEVRIDIEVDGERAPHVVITELMKNPAVLADADGEWIELYNAGLADIDLGGCSLARDEQELTIEGSLVLAAGAYLTFSNGEAPGFAPDVLYSGFALPNTDSFVLRLSCGSQSLDEITVDPAVPSQRAGRSLSLSGSALDEGANDDHSNWCEGTTSYDGDFGSPGAENPECAP